MMCGMCTRGWVARKEWPEKCRVCDGLGTLTIGAIARKIGEDHGVVARLNRRGGRVRRKTAERILDKLVALMREAA